MYGDFFLIERDSAAASRAERLALGQTSGRNEAWVRDTLFAHPEIVPVRDIDPSFGPLIPLCTELRTPAGPLDLAFINPNGQLTLVECKLWRNQEARREVVAQVLDYARAISRWNYADLQRQVCAALGQQGNLPYELAQAVVPDLSEQRFVDDTSRAMRSGKFLLMIAGDGIRDGVEAITELINRNAASGFSFALVEVALYGFDDGSLAIQPRVSAKTSIIQRTVVVVREAGNSAPLPIVDEDDAAVQATVSNGELVVARDDLGESPKQAEYRAWWTPVMLSHFQDPDQGPPVLYYPNNVRTALPWPQTWIGAWRYGGAPGTVGVALGGLSPSYNRMIEALSPSNPEILSELPPGSELVPNSKRDSETFRTIRRAADFATDDEMRRWIVETMNTYVNVFRPRLKAEMESQS